MQIVRAAAVQFQHLPGEKDANLAIVRDFVSRAAREGVRIIAFPEMCLTGYWHVRKLQRSEVEALAEPVPDGAMTRALLRMAEEHSMTIGAGLIERAPDGTLYNTYVVAMPDSRHARHRKLHTFISTHMASGNEYTVFDAPFGARVGVLTCYDNNIVENARMMGLMGVDILMAPHQTGGCRSRSPRAMGAIDPMLWVRREENPAAIEAEILGPKGRGWLMRWLPARAHDNGMFLLFSNGIGVDDDEVRTGNAMIIDCYGEILIESRRAANDMVIADLDGAMLEDCTGRRWLRARRPELYGKIAEKLGIEQNIRQIRLGE